MNPTALIVLSHATYTGPSGSTAAATYSFLTDGYQPPAEPRHIQYDVVHNQNGKFKWIYDNGPGFKRWPSFMIRCRDAFDGLVEVNAAVQLQRLKEMWNHKGLLIMQAPEGIYNVHWAPDPVEQSFIIFPSEVVDPVEIDVQVQFEEG
jgi:hypothetical protein